MSDRSRWDPEMLAYQAAAEAIAATFPPVRLEIPLEPHRAVNDAISLARGARGPEMAETTERWVAARGRRIYCRVHRPRTDRPLPVVVYFHGGGWVWGSVDTHDSAARSLAAAGDVATVSVDYALSPEAKFPQALEECAAVVRHVAREGAAWGLDPARILLAVIRQAAISPSRRHCCCATAAARRFPASSPPTRCATAASTRSATRSSPPATC